MKELNVTQVKARKLIKKICEDFEIQSCKVFYIDFHSVDCDTIGLYINEEQGWDFPYMLIEKNWSRRLIIILHEICHHIQYEAYYNPKESSHGYGFQLAKSRVTTWATKNISDNFDWGCFIKGKTEGRICKKKKKKK